MRANRINFIIVFVYLLFLGHANAQADTVSPVAVIIYPVPNQIVFGTIDVNISAYDNLGVKKIEFFVDGVFDDRDVTEPYRFTWNAQQELPLTAQAALAQQSMCGIM